jgi:hypothetical protein
MIEVIVLRSLKEQPESVSTPPDETLNPRERRAVALVAHGAVLLQVDAFASGASWAFERDRGQTLATTAV